MDASSALVAPVDQPVNELMQTILIAGSYIIWAALILYSMKLGLQERTPFYTILVIVAGYGGVYEPIYDETLMLYFYRPGQISIYTAFEIPQPIWTLSGYATLYASVALFFTRDVVRGMTVGRFWKYCIAEFLSSCTFEMIAINGGAYEYWGPHVFRIFKYPICIGLLETVQVISFSVLAACLRSLINSKTLNFGYTTKPTTGSGLAKVSSQILASLPYCTLFFLFPFTFMGSNVGVGAPSIVALHSASNSEALVTLGSLATILGVGMALFVLSHITPTEGYFCLTAAKPNNTESDYLDARAA